MQMGVSMMMAAKHKQVTRQAMWRHPWRTLLVGASVVGVFGLTSVAAVGPAAATGTTLYAGATMSATGSACSLVSPCSLSTALAQVTAGGIVALVTAGTTAHYDGGFSVSTAGTSAIAPVTIEPAPGVSGPILDGGGGSTVLSVPLGIYVDLSGVSIQNGHAGQGGGIYNRGQLVITSSTISGNSGGQGGGIYNNSGTVTVTGSTISGNTAPGGGQGGGIFNFGTVTVTGSTISGNTAPGGGLGGAIFEDGGTLTITGSTISGNTALGSLGGAIFDDNGTATVTSSTISANTASTGGGIYNDVGTFVLAGDLLATPGAPSVGGECAGSVFTDDGYNVSDDATCGLGAMTSVGNSAAAEDLGALTNNGGPTETIFPMAGNPAINNIPTTGTTLCPATDQRGLTTAIGSPCDAGAVQVAVKFPQTITLTSTTPTNATVGGSYTVSATGGASGDAVVFATTSTGVCTVGTSTANSATVTFTGAGACVVKADQAGNTVYGAAPEATQSVTVAQPAVVALGSQTITFSGAATGTYGGSATLSAAGGASGNPVTFTVDPTSGTGVCTTGGADGSLVSYTGAGTCVIDANQALGTNYAAAPQVARSITVDQAGQFITFTSASPADAKVGGSFTVSAAGGASGIPVIFSTASTDCSVAAGLVSFTAGGTCIIDANQAGDANYAAAPEVAQTIAVVASLAGGGQLAATPDGTGYWLVGPDGSLSAYGSAVNFGSVTNKQGKAPIVGIAPTPDGRGYWLVTSDGGVFTFGDAVFHGSIGGSHLNRPVVAMSSTPDGRGYWLVTSDGGVFSFGDAVFHGSMGGSHLNRPVVAVASTPDGRGYWLVTSDGGVFSFGDAVFHGSMGGSHLNRPVVGMASTPDGRGYWLVASDGGVFSFGDAAFHGSMGGSHARHSPIVGLFFTGAGTGYTLVSNKGKLTTFGG
jgi:hypothetical protein